MAQQILANGAVATYSSETGNVIASTGLVLDQAGLSAAVPQTIIDTPSVSGVYLISFAFRIISPATGPPITNPGSTLGPLTVFYTCADSGTSAQVIGALNLADGTISTTDTRNTVASGWSGSIVICAQAGSPISISVGYASSGTAKMVYNYHAKAVFLGGLPG